MGKLLLGAGLIYVLYKLMVLADEIESTTARVCRIEEEMLKAIKNTQNT